MSTDQRCGTYAGYKRHRYLKESICDPCRVARNDYTKNYNHSHGTTPFVSAKCGTRSGYEAHRVKKEDPCLDCCLANAARTSQVRALLAKVTDRGWTSEEILTTHGTDCHICNEPIDLTAPRSPRKGANWKLGLHFDHVIPLSKGGTNSVDNVRPSHAICNMQKNSKILETL